MGPDGVADVSDVDGVEMFVVGLTLHKYLHTYVRIYYLYIHTCIVQVLYMMKCEEVMK